MSGLAQTMNSARARMVAEQAAIVVRRLACVVEQAGAHHVVGGLERRESDVEPGEDRQVALRPEMEDALGAAAPRSMPRVTSPELVIAVVGLARHAEPVEDALHRRRPARGALVISMTVPPPARNRASASQASGKAATPLCTTPQTSHSSTS